MHQAIEGARAILPLVEQRHADQLGPVRDTLSQLQMAYSQLRQGGGGDDPEGGGGGGGAGSEAGPQAAPGARLGAVLRAPLGPRPVGRRTTL